MDREDAKKLVKALSEEELDDLIKFMELLFQKREANQEQPYVV